MPLRHDLIAVLGPPHVSGIVGEWRHGSRRLAVLVRNDGDVQVEFHVPDETGSPFEALFVVPPGEEPQVAQAVSEFVERLLSEELVLAIDGRFMRGGRLWLKSKELETAKHPAFVLSWRGSFDERS
jgi:hypothetical protein